MERMKDMGARIAYALDQVGSRRSAAKRLGTHEPTLRGYTSGENKPGAEKILSICELTGVSADFILGLSEDPHGQRVAPPTDSKIVSRGEWLSALPPRVRRIVIEIGDALAASDTAGTPRVGTRTTHTRKPSASRKGRGGS